MSARGRRVTMGIVTAGLLVPRSAMACATCVSSAFGNQTYNWPYFGLILMPFLITGVVGAVLYHYRGARRSSDAHGVPSDGVPAMDTLLDKEMT